MASILTRACMTMLDGISVDDAWAAMKAEWVRDNRPSRVRAFGMLMVGFPRLVYKILQVAKCPPE